MQSHSQRRVIRIVGSTILDGPNTWSQRSVIHLLVDAGDAEMDSTGQLAALLASFELVTGDDGSSDPGQPAATGDAGKVLEAQLFEMQVLAGETITFSHSHSAAKSGHYDVVCEFQDKEVAIAAANLAVRLLNSLLFQTEPEFAFNREFDRRVRQLVRSRAHRRQANAVVDAARSRGIPVRNDPTAYNLIELGSGAYTRRYWSMSSSQTSQVGARISNSKSLTNRILRERGIPVPQSTMVRTVDAALKAAEQIGYPVVVKPTYGSQGRGVGIDLRTPEKVRDFFAVAMKTRLSKSVTVENFIPGKEYRILVVGDRIAAVAERMPAHVTGDGTHTISQLIEMTNAEEMRGPGHQEILTRIAIDAAAIDALERQNLTLESIPEAGRYVQVKLASNMSQGGTSYDRTDEIHPDNARLARLAAKTIEIDICGVDLITPDISKSVLTNGGAFLEVNYGPGFNLHLHPQFGVPRDVGSAVIEMLYPPGDPCRATVIAVAGAAAAATCRQIERIVQATGQTVGMATSEGIRIDGHVMHPQNVVGQSPHQFVLGNPYVECAVFEIENADIDQRGLAFDSCDVAVITSEDEATARAAGTRTVAQVLLETSRSEGAAVLDAGHPQFRDLMQHVPSSAVLFGADAEAAAIQAHVSEGGQAVVRLETPDGGAIALLSTDDVHHLVSWPDIALPSEMGPEALGSSALAAASAAVALGLAPELIGRALRDAPGG